MPESGRGGRDIDPAQQGFAGGRADVDRYTPGYRDYFGNSGSSDSGETAGGGDLGDDRDALRGTWGGSQPPSSYPSSYLAAAQEYEAARASNRRMCGTPSNCTSDCAGCCSISRCLAEKGSRVCQKYSPL